MPAGRKRKPRHLKVVDGTNRADRENPDAPEPSDGTPEAPEWMSDRARGYFGLVVSRLGELGLASASHTEMLTATALRLEEVEELTEVLETEGRTYETTSTSGGHMIRPHPAVAQRNEALRHLQSLLAEFGLSPASNGKVSVGHQGKATDPAERYFGT